MADKKYSNEFSDNNLQDNINLGINNNVNNNLVNDKDKKIMRLSNISPINKKTTNLCIQYDDEWKKDSQSHSS